MTVTIDLTPEQEKRVRQIADNRGVEVAEVVRELVNRSLESDPTDRSGVQQKGLTKEEFISRLRAAGVRIGSPQSLQELLRSWRGVDNDPDSTVREWEQIQRNIEEGGLELHRLRL